jgi:hypothetical protein
MWLNFLSNITKLKKQTLNGPFFHMFFHDWIAQKGAQKHLPKEM